jgi:YggT family protein
MRNLLCILILLYTLAIIGRAILSWFPVSPDSALAVVNGFLFRITEPLMAPIRRAMPPVRAGGIGIDLSVMIIIIVLFVLRGIIC